MNLLESLDKREFDFFNQLKDRTRLDYGLKYEIISINNGTATVISSKNTQNMANSSNATPLALTLYTQNGLNNLIRSHFNYNKEICDNFRDDPNSSNVKSLWEWFESTTNHKAISSFRPFINLNLFIF